MSRPLEEVWTAFYYGGALTLCERFSVGATRTTKERAIGRALRAARQCEARGGAPHRLLDVVEIERTDVDE